jgi:hypothetical protein
VGRGLRRACAESARESAGRCWPRGANGAAAQPVDVDARCPGGRARPHRGSLGWPGRRRAPRRRRAGRSPDRRRAAAVGGYAATAVLSGLIGVVTSAWQVGVLRAGAWAARGLRVPSRNAPLADVVPAAVYGRAYGSERAMDSLGARSLGRCWPARWWGWSGCVRRCCSDSLDALEVRAVDVVAEVRRVDLARSRSPGADHLDAAAGERRVLVGSHGLTRTLQRGPPSLETLTRLSCSAR